MKYEYTGRHIDVTPALRSHVEEHFGRLDHLFNGDATKAHVIIEVERGRHRSEINVNWRNEVLTANSSVADMYQSLSQTIDKIEKQALKIKNKVIDRSHRAKRATTIVPNPTDVKPTPTTPRVIKTRRYAVKPVTVDEAAMMLSAERDSFLVFRNADNQKISVIHTRKDGNYGLIEP